MKTSQIFLFALIGCASAWAQTNTFPTSGDVGIGTTTPEVKLHVIGQDVRFFSNTGRNALEIGRDNVQKFKFDVWDNHAYMDLLQDSDGNGPHIMYFRNLAQGTSPDNDIRFQTSSVDRLTIKTNGNIGIGTSNPNHKFQIGETDHGSTSGVTNVFMAGTDFELLLYNDRPFDSSGKTGKIRFGSKYNSSGTYTVGAEIYGFRQSYQTNNNYEYALGFDTRAQGETVSRKLTILGDGNVGIGTTAPDDKLTVKGRIHAEEVKVDLSVPGPDYVFKEGYDLKSLEEVQEHIKKKGHLPNIPSAQEMEENGVELGIMNMKLLEKIEELTLYMIDIQGQVEQLKNENAELKRELTDLK